MLTVQDLGEGETQEFAAGNSLKQMVLKKFRNNIIDIGTCHQYSEMSHVSKMFANVVNPKTKNESSDNKGGKRRILVNIKTQEK